MLNNIVQLGSDLILDI